MAVIDGDGKGWIGDPDGGIVRFGSKRSFEIKSDEFKKMSLERREESRQGDIIDLEKRRSSREFGDLTEGLKKAANLIDE